MRPHVAEVYGVTTGCFHVSRRLAVREVRLALSNFYNIAIRIANVTARLAILVLGLRDERGSSASPSFIAGLNIRNADILRKAADRIGVGGDARGSVLRWFVGCRAAPDVDNRATCSRSGCNPAAPLLSPLLRMLTTEDRFVKSKRSFDVGDGEKVCDGNAVLRRHLIGFRLDPVLGSSTTPVRTS